MACDSLDSVPTSLLRLFGLWLRLLNFLCGPLLCELLLLCQISLLPALCNRFCQVNPLFARLFSQVVLLLRAGASSGVILGGTFLRECLAVGALFALLLTHTGLGRVEGLLTLV